MISSLVNGDCIFPTDLVFPQNNYQVSSKAEFGIGGGRAWLFGGMESTNVV